MTTWVLYITLSPKESLFEAIAWLEKRQGFYPIKHLELALVIPKIINKNLVQDLKILKIEEIANQIILFIFSLFDFMPKHDKTRNKIFNISIFSKHLVYNYILDNTREIRYI